MTRKAHLSNNRGVTLVEIAIVLVIIGLLLGGVLKGQELINNAKVRAMADRQNSLKIAWFSFIDRYQAIPGDYVGAEANVPGAVASGNGDGVINIEGESVNVLQNLTGAGYLRCPVCVGTSVTTDEPTAENSLVNQYGGAMGIFHDSTNYATIGNGTGLGPDNRPRLLVHTGHAIPSNIIAEVDRKIDDGFANTGDFVFNQWATAGAIIPDVAECTADKANPTTQGESYNGSLYHSHAISWRGVKATPAVIQSCGASVVI